VALAASLAAQQPLTLQDVVTTAMEKYPTVRVSTKQAAAAAAGIRLARTAYLPRIDSLAQLNRATHNNIFGMLLPQPGLPALAPISGPVLGTNSLESVWGSAVGVLVSWEPFDFGLRQANIRVAEAGETRAAAQAGLTRLETGTAAADAFLTLLAAQQGVAAARASVDRAKVLDEVVGSLVRSDLRPGAEASRTRAELALAQTQLVRADEAVRVARAALAQFVNAAPESIAIAPGRLLELPPEQEPPGPAQHPLAAAEQAAIGEIQAREKALDRSYFPHVNLQATSYARGTGIQATGATGGAASGLGPNIQNWGLGVTVTFSPLEFASINARKEIERHRALAAEARYDQVLTELRSGVEQARARVQAAREVARNTPRQLEAARAAEQQATARYRAGLGTVVEVAEAQRLLAQAEIDDALARLSVWRALAGLTAARGDLAPLVELSK
jgi:outer membrane protein TolC